MTNLTVYRHNNNKTSVFIFPVDQLEYACGIFGFTILNDINKNIPDVRAEVDRINELAQTGFIDAEIWLKTYRVELPLQQYYQLAYQAYSGISFSPEKRADSTITEYSKMLAEDLPQVPDNYKEKYQQKFISHFTDWLHSKSRCMSSMITGPANFPSARMQKYNQWEDNKYNDFMAWRKRILAALARSERKRTAPSEFQKATNDLSACKKNHEIMKQANAIIRKSKGADTCIPALIELGINEMDAHELLHPKFAYYGQGYASFSLTNNNANIKRLEQRVKELTVKEEMKAKIEQGGEVPEMTINGAIIRKDFADDRLKIIFDGKPAQNVIDSLKSSGFRWSPYLKCWCRKLTSNAVYVAKMICTKELATA